MQPDVSQQGTPKRHFDLVDDTGSWISCCALGSNASSLSLEAGNDVVLYFVTGRSATGSNPGMLYLMKDSVIVMLGRRHPHTQKKHQVEIS